VGTEIGRCGLMDGDVEAESNRPATNFSDIAFDPNELCRLVEERGLRNS
jgi:hypothetical protein